jgi:UDP-glucose 6-dehydrogenase
MKTAIVGYGVVGKAYHKVFPQSVIYDPHHQPIPTGQLRKNPLSGEVEQLMFEPAKTTKAQVNDCDVAIVAVFTPHKQDGSLDISIVEEVVSWIECPLIIIKSALHPGTVDYLVEKYKKRIAVSVEYIGEGNYPVHFWKYPHQSDPRYHQMLVVGGQPDVAEEAAQVLWRYLSPDIKIHKVTALEAEIIKLVENSYGALKVTFANTFLSLAEKSGTSFVDMHQAWNADPRTDSMHLRAVSFEKGWTSKCWDKDIPALVAYAKKVGANDTAKLFQTVVDINEGHLKERENIS